MPARSTPLVGDVLDELPARCRACVFWELGGARPRDDEEAAADDRVRKQAWVTAQSLEGTPPGVVVRDGRRAVAYALFAPARSMAPRAAGVPVASTDALVLATAWVAPEARGRNTGRVLVQAALREAVRLERKAVEAHGDRRGVEGACVLPLDWLVHEGFEVTAEHPRYPLLRIDVRRAARWAESLEAAVDELLGRARPAVAPQPVRAERG